MQLYMQPTFASTQKFSGTAPLFENDNSGQPWLDYAKVPFPKPDAQKISAEIPKRPFNIHPSKACQNDIPASVAQPVNNPPVTFDWRWSGALAWLLLAFRRML
jgi:hypothetical protein